MDNPRLGNDLGLEINVDLSREDLSRTLFWYQKKRLRLIGALFALFLLVGGAAASFVIVSMVTGSGGRPILASLPLLIPPLVPAGLVALVLLLLVVQIRRQVKVMSASTEPTRFTFSNDGMDAVTESTSLHTNWSKYKKVVETKTDFLLFPQVNYFYPIPKRFFRNEHEIKVFRGMVSDNVSGALELLTD